MPFQYLVNSFMLNFKLRYFKNKIKKFRETKDFNLILNLNIDNIFNTLLCLFAMIGLSIFVFLCVVVGVLLVVLILQLLITTSSIMTNIVALIVAFIGFGSIIYQENKKRKNVIAEMYDESVHTIIQYLIEIKRENYDYKLHKDVLSFLFLNTPNNTLLIVRDIQDNIKNHNSSLDKDTKEKYKLVINKEILFLIVYFREYFNFTSIRLRYDLEHEKAINDIIDNSSVKKTKPKS